MRLEFALIPKKDIIVQDMKTGVQEIEIDKSYIQIIIDGSIVSEVRFIFDNVEYQLIPFAEEMRISYNQEKIKQQLYKLCSYVSNRMYAESHTDAFDCNETQNLTPKTFAENEQEQEDIQKYKPFNISIFTTVSSIVDDIKIENYKIGYEYEKAFTAFADGMRVNNIATRYVQYWKAIEALLLEGKENHKKMTNKEISEIVSKYSLPKSEEDISYLRKVRNRCEHTYPYNEEVHLSTSNRESIKELEKATSDLFQIAKILFSHFTENKLT